MPDPAPGPLRLVQSFVNALSASREAPDLPATLSASREAADLLATREEAAAWLRAAALLPAESGLSGSEHAALLRLREAVRNSLAAHTGGRDDSEAASRLTKALAEGRLVVTVDPASSVQLASAARASYPGVVAAIAVAIAEAAAAGTWLRLKFCSGSACGQAFYDNSAAAGAQGCDTHVAQTG
ncbi:MAG: ABATE domain-containing protein [Streptosporangiaceae bacterium]